MSDFDFQRKVFLAQKQAREKTIAETRSLTDLLFAWIPRIQCPTMVRLGRVTDGGKWTCNPWRLPAPCRVYSFGVGNDVSFEEDLNTVTGGRCEFFVFDPNPSYKSLVGGALPGATFLPEKLRLRTLISFIASRNHSLIHVLKIDVEGDEFDIVPFLLNPHPPAIPPRIAQVLVEIHHAAGGGRWSTGDYRNLLRVFDSGGFLLFSKEPNHHSEGGLCVEFSFIHRDFLEMFALSRHSLILGSSGR